MVTRISLRSSTGSQTKRVLDSAVQAVSPWMCWRWSADLWTTCPGLPSSKKQALVDRSWIGPQSRTPIGGSLHIHTYLYGLYVYIVHTCIYTYPLRSKATLLLHPLGSDFAVPPKTPSFGRAAIITWSRDWEAHKSIRPVANLQVSISLWLQRHINAVLSTWTVQDSSLLGLGCLSWPEYSIKNYLG